MDNNRNTKGLKQTAGEFRTASRCGGGQSTPLNVSKIDPGPLKHSAIRHDPRITPATLWPLPPVAEELPDFILGKKGGADVLLKPQQVTSNTFDVVIAHENSVSSAVSKRSSSK